jgi:hypothetical protein
MQPRPQAKLNEALAVPIFWGYDLTDQGRGHRVQGPGDKAHTEDAETDHGVLLKEIESQEENRHQYGQDTLCHCKSRMNFFDLKRLAVPAGHFTVQCSEFY